MLVLLPIAAGALGFEAVTLGFSQAWTGSDYVTTSDGRQVTGSESFPIDPFLSVGARFGLLDGFGSSAMVLAVNPELQAGARYYVLYESGRVAPASIETGTGGEGNTLGRGSALIYTLRLALPVAYDIRFGGNAIFMSISPTFIFRIPGGDEALREDEPTLFPMYRSFYEFGRFVMPEVALGFRFALSDYLDATIRATYGLSIGDTVIAASSNDPTLPWYEEMRVGLGVDIGFRPPFGGLFREREDPLPEGVEPFPEGGEVAPNEE